MKPKVSFMCTGMCGEDHPRHDHCKDCSHANFRVVAGSVVVWYCPLFGADIRLKNGKILDVPQDSFLWEVAQELGDFADRNFKKWNGKK